jgi:hypothetical protein
LKKYRIKQINKPEIKDWCRENLGTENVRWWFQEDLIGMKTWSHSDHTLVFDVTEEEESQLMYFILKYGE